MASPISPIENDIDQEISNICTLDDILKFLQESEVSNIVDSVSYDVKSQALISHFTQLLKKEAEMVSKGHHEDGNSDDERIKKLSEYYKEKYFQFLNDYKHWKTSREKVIKLLTDSSTFLKRSSTHAFAFRILTSVADIFGILAQFSGRSGKTWPAFAMEHASLIGLIAHIIEMNYSKKLYDDLRNAIKNERKLFKETKDQWWKEIEKLDESIESFFPHGLDMRIAEKIGIFPSNLDYGSRFFISIVLSNVVKDVSLIKNTEFLAKANCVASSEIGHQWFNKAILEYDPWYHHYYNSEQCEKVEECLKISVNEEFYVDLCKNLPSSAGFKVTLNMFSIFSGVYNILLGAKSEVCDQFQELAKNLKVELKDIENIVSLIDPSKL